MPKCHKGENNQEIDYSSCLAPPAARPWTAASSKRDIDVTNNPAIETPVPSTPEGEGRVVVRHATNHVLRRVDAIHEGPQPEESPR